MTTASVGNCAAVVKQPRRRRLRNGPARVTSDTCHLTFKGTSFLDVGMMSKTNESGETTNQAGKRILLVDDDNEIVESMRFALETKGYRILVARDGNQGLAMAERENPDLVILDMMMPKRSGFLVLEKLRRTLAVPVRVIMITANEGSRHKAYAEMLGVDDYIRKPFAMDRLLDSVDRLLA
jgi:CheY-like chemotaxis protein